VRPVDSRADLYSLGAVLYVLLARRPLFQAKSVPEMLHKQRFERPEAVGRYASDVPAELEQIIGQLLEKEPDRRIPNPGILARRLEAMEHGLSRESATVQTDVDSPGDPSDSGSVPPDLRDDLPETRATAAFEDLGEAAHSTPADSPGAKEPAAPKSAGRFTPVAEEELDRSETEKTQQALISPQTWALAAGLIAVGLGVWYFFQGPSAETLYGEITARTAEGSIDSLLEAEDDIREFLVRFPADSRCGPLRRYEKEIELHRLERKFQRRAKGLAGSEGLAPIERAYLEAINYAQLDPERGMAKLEALIYLYGDRTDTSGPTGQCLELARRRLGRLREQLDRQTPQYLAMLQSQIDRAEQIGRTDPDRARAMYRAVIELYAERPWAAKAVKRARNALISGFGDLGISGFEDSGQNPEIPKSLDP